MPSNKKKADQIAYVVFPIAFGLVSSISPPAKKNTIAIIKETNPTITKILLICPDSPK